MILGDNFFFGSMLSPLIKKSFRLKNGCNIYEDKIPISNVTTQTCNEFNLESTTVALSGGEDYELLFTIKQEDIKEIEKNPDLSIIGHINSKKEMNLVTKTGKNIAIKSMGWKSF